MILQIPHYASSASVYHPEMASPAPAVASQPGVTSKVSAWLQQTHDIDATSNGESCIRDGARKRGLILDYMSSIFNNEYRFDQ